MKTMICLILDRSGSMQGRENDVVGGVNSFIEEQKKLPDPASMAFVRFDSEAIERFRPMQELSEVKPFSRNEFQPRASTPLLDAVGQTITKLDEDWKIEKPDRCIVIIVTDGEENSSREYTKAKIQELVKARQDSGLWAFIYLGANVDAFAEAGSMGFAASNTAGYMNTARGTSTVYAAAASAATHMRMTGATLATNLNRNIGEDDAVKPTVGSATKIIPQTNSWTPPAATGGAVPSVSAWIRPA